MWDHLAEQMTRKPVASAQRAARESMKRMTAAT